MSDRTCAHCTGPLPVGCRRNRVYCSKYCTSAAHWAANKADRLASHRAWRYANRERWAAERLAAKPLRRCEECGAELPREARSTRRFCSRKCINAKSVRENLAERAKAAMEWRRRNPEKVAAIRAAYRDQQAAIMNRYYQANPDVFRETRNRRRAREAQAQFVGISRRDWTRIVIRFGSRCAYCDALRPLTVDHVVPISRGGLHGIGNVLPACRPCNTSKSDRLLVEWRRLLRRTGRRSLI